MKNKIVKTLLLASLALVLCGANQTNVGQVTVTLTGPVGLTRVDGLNAKADAYIKKVEPKFKLRVLALYADQTEWPKFVSQLEAGRPTSLPRLAMLCVTAKMPDKKYDPQAMRKEFSRYNQWFSLAANNRPLAALLTSQGNKKLKEIMGVDIGFKFKTDDYTKKLAETSSSLTLGARVSFNLYGRDSEIYLTATSLGVGDKLVFMGYFENTGPAEKMADVEAKTLAWRNEMSRLNAAQYNNLDSQKK